MKRISILCGIVLGLLTVFPTDMSAWNYLICRNNVDGNWESEAANMTKVDENTFYYDLSKEAIAAKSIDKIWFRLRNGDAVDGQYPQIYPQASGTTIAYGTSTNIYYQNTTSTDWSFGVEIPTFDYEKVRITATYSNSDGAWKWYIGVDVYVNVTSAHPYSTFSFSEPLNFDEVSGFAYTAEMNGSVVEFKEFTGNAPAGAGLLLKGENVSKSVKIAASASDLTNNVLVGAPNGGTIEPTTDGKTNFVLMNGNAGIGFYKFTSTFTLGAGTAYISTALADVAKTFIAVEDGETTGINEIERSNDNVYYSLDGMRVNNPSKGLYVVNGKKVVLK